MRWKGNGMKLTFFGANRQVTGSRYCLEAAGRTVLIDCGLFQERPFLERNWKQCPVPPQSIEAVLLTHAHLDHSGLLPRLVRHGFHGPIYTTGASAELAALVLHDSARLQQEDLEIKQARHQREGRLSPHPYEPLYTPDDAQRALGLFRRVAYDQPLKVDQALTVTWHDAGHILGSGLLEIVVREGERERHLVFSGDLGQWNTPIIKDPTLLTRADYVVMESTYGDKDHDGAGTIEEQLARVINETHARGGNLIVPTFAIERAQELVFYLGRLTRAGKIPHLMVFLDSPMAVDATDIFRRHPECFDPQIQALLKQQESPFTPPGVVFCRTTDQSKAINHLRGSAIIMAGSGMCTGGRIKHHLDHHLERPESTILFVGYQSQGTLGRQIMDGAREVRLFGRMRPVRAQVAQIHGMSAHAGRSDLLRWIGSLQAAPRQVFITHGEEEVSLALARELQQKFQWNVLVPQYGQAAELP